MLLQSNTGLAASLLAPLLAQYPGDLSVLFEAWLQSGARHVGLWADGGWLACGGNPSLRPNEWLAAPVQVRGRTVAELRVAGLTDCANAARLTADARLVAGLAEAAGDLDALTAELSETQDRLLALYDLAESMRTHLDLQEVLRLLAGEAQRLLRSEVGFMVLTLADTPSQTAVAGRSSLPPSTLVAYYEQVARERGATLMNARESTALDGSTSGSILVVPIKIRGQIQACLGCWSARERSFTSPDLKLAQAIAEQAGVQIENAILHQETISQARLQAEADLARNVQVGLLPRRLPHIAGVDLFASMRPALEVGGDFYDFLINKSGGCLFCVGDVSGKGMSSAILMAMTRTVLRNTARYVQTASPQSMLDRATSDLYNDYTEVGMFSTTFVGQVEPGGRSLAYANAGHSPVIFCPSDGPARLLEADGPGIGVLPVCLSEDQTLSWTPGDVLIVATDGFAEQRNGAGEMFGYDRLLHLAESVRHQSAAGIGQALLAAVADFAVGRAQDDDQTLVILKATPA